MRKILKIHGKGILHILDLKREFDPWEIYNQLEVFCAFVRVHSLPLSLMIGHERAAILDKKFWYYVLTGQYCGKAADEDAKKHEEIISQSGDAQTCLKAFFDDLFYRETLMTRADIAAGKKSIGNVANEKLAMLDDEVREGRYIEKISHICQEIGTQDGSIQTAIKMLAICELAEVDALSCSFRTANQSVISDFGAEKQLILKASSQPYQYWHYGDETLKEDEQIRTVKLTVSGKGNAVIELYSMENQECVERVMIEAGESRWLNAVGNRVIKFLPSSSTCGSQTITQETRGQEMLRIQGTKNDEWVLNLPDVSSFSTAGEEEGFLLIRNGEIVSLYYHRCNDTVSQMRLEMIPGPVVEVQLTSDGYLILRSNGQVASDFMKTDKKYVSLDDVRNG